MRDGYTLQRATGAVGNPGIGGGCLCQRGGFVNGNVGAQIGVGLAALQKMGG